MSDAVTRGASAGAMTDSVTASTPHGEPTIPTYDELRQAEDRLNLAICEAGNHAFLPSSVAIPLHEYLVLTQRAVRPRSPERPHGDTAPWQNNTKILESRYAAYRAAGNYANALRLAASGRAMEGELEHYDELFAQALDALCAVASSCAAAPAKSVEQEMQDRGWQLSDFDAIDSELYRLMQTAKFYAMQLATHGPVPEPSDDWINVKAAGALRGAAAPAPTPEPK